MERSGTYGPTVVDVVTGRAAWLTLLLAIGVTALACAVARWWVEATLAFGARVSVLGNAVRLTRSENTGIALGVLQGSPLVPWLSTLALIAVAVYLARVLWHGRAGNVAVGLLLGGGLANLLDRLGDGRVTDYLDFGVGAWRYPTFNLPDSAIVVGLGLVLWLFIRDAAALDGPRAGHSWRNTAHRLDERDDAAWN